jgi:3-phenylpropionate/cinnamic acid dioxygenase small subunit
LTDVIASTTDRALCAADLIEIAKIEDVMLEYCDAFDEGRISDVVAQFTAECRFDLGFGDVRQGRESLYEFLAMRAALYSATSHHVSNIRIRLSADDAATATSYVYARSWHRGTEFTSELWGRYRDTLVKVDGVWQIAERLLRAAGSARFPVPEGRPASFELIERRGADPA